MGWLCREMFFLLNADFRLSLNLNSIMGLPPREDWPNAVALPWSSFRPVPKQPLERLIHEIEPAAKHLLEVHLLALFWGVW